MATYEELLDYANKYNPQPEQLGVSSFNQGETIQQEETPYQKMMRETYGNPAQMQGQPGQQGAEEPTFTGSLFRGAMAQGLGTIGGQVDAASGITQSETLRNIGDSIQSAMQSYARPKEYTFEDITKNGLSSVKDYLLDPNGFTYDVGGGLGSTGAMLAEAALLSAAIPSSVAAAGTGAVAALAARLGLKSVATALTKGGTAANLIKKVIASSPLEASSETGGVMREMTTDENGKRINFEDADMDKVQEAMAKNFVANLGILGASNLLESVGIGRLFGKKMQQGILGKVKDIGAFMATNGVQNAWEEGAQEGASQYAQGKMDNISQIVNPFEWNPEQVNAATIGLAAGIGQGTLVGGAGHVMNKMAGQQQQEGNPAVNIQNKVTNDEFADAVAIAKHDTSTNLVDRMRNLEGRIAYNASDGTNCARTIGLALAGTDYQDLINVDNFVAVAKEKGQLKDPSEYVPKPGDLAVVNNGNHIVMVSDNGGTIQNGSSANGVYESAQSPLQMFGAVKYYISTSELSGGESQVGTNLSEEDIVKERNRRNDAIREVLGAKTHEQEQQEQNVLNAEQYQASNASDIGPIANYYDAFTEQELDALSPEQKQTLKDNFDSFYAEKKNWSDTSAERVQTARGMYSQLIGNRQQTPVVNNVAPTAIPTAPQVSPNATPSSPSSAPTATQVAPKANTAPTTTPTTANTTKVENPVVQQQQAQQTQQNQDVVNNATPAAPATPTATPATGQQQNVQQSVAQQGQPAAQEKATPATQEISPDEWERRLQQETENVAAAYRDGNITKDEYDRRMQAIDDAYDTNVTQKRGLTQYTPTETGVMERQAEEQKAIDENVANGNRVKFTGMIDDLYKKRKNGQTEEDKQLIASQINAAHKAGLAMLDKGATAEEAFDAVKDSIGTEKQKARAKAEGEKQNGKNQKPAELSQPKTDKGGNQNVNTQPKQSKQEQGEAGQSTENQDKVEVKENGTDKGTVSEATATGESGGVSENGRGRKTGAVSGHETGAGEKVLRTNDADVRNQESDRGENGTSGLPEQSADVGRTADRQDAVRRELSTAESTHNEQLNKVNNAVEEGKVTVEEAQKQIDKANEEYDKALDKAEESAETASTKEGDPIVLDDSAQRIYDDYKFVVVKVGKKSYRLSVVKSNLDGKGVLTWTTLDGKPIKGTDNPLKCLLWEAIKTNDDGDYLTLDQVIESLESKKDRTGLSPNFQEALDFAKKLKNTNTAFKTEEVISFGTGSAEGSTGTARSRNAATTQESAQEQKEESAKQAPQETEEEAAQKAYDKEVEKIEADYEAEKITRTEADDLIAKAQKILEDTLKELEDYKKRKKESEESYAKLRAGWVAEDKKKKENLRITIGNKTYTPILSQRESTDGIEDYYTISGWTDPDTGEKVKGAMGSLLRNIQLSLGVGKLSDATLKPGNVLMENVVDDVVKRFEKINQDLIAEGRRPLELRRMNELIDQLKADGKEATIHFADDITDTTTKYSASVEEASARESEKGQELKRSLDDLITEAKKAFKGATKFRINRDDLIFTMPNGLEMKVNIKDQIILSAEDEAKARKEHGLSDDERVIVEGYAKALDKGSLVVLSKEGQKGTTFHEAFHTVWNWVLNDKEKQAMLKHFTPIAKEKGIDVEEAMADGYRDWLLARQQHKGTIFGKLYQKVLDFANAALRVLTGAENVHNIYQQIEEGKVWNRDAKGRFATEENAVNNTNDIKTSIRQKATDKEYFDAIERGDMDAVQRMVDEKADATLNNILLPNDDDEVGFKYHRGPAPTKTFKRYAVLNVTPDGFKAAYAGNKTGTPVGVWLDAQNLQSYTSDITQFDDGSFATYIPGDTGHSFNDKFSPELKQKMIAENGLKAGQSWLLERGGKHSSDVPNFSQMNLGQDENGNKVKNRAKDGALPHNKLIFEIEYGITEGGDLTDYVREHGRMMKGKNQGLAKIQPNQYYDFKTNANAVGNWGIGGTFRIVRLVPHSEIVEQTAKFKREQIEQANKDFEKGLISKADRDKRIKNANAIGLQKWVGGYNPADFNISVESVDDLYKQGQKSKIRDAITYDDDGNIIPLSQRFNPEITDDVRYSIRLASGKEITSADLPSDFSTSKPGGEKAITDPQMELTFADYESAQKDKTFFDNVIEKTRKVVGLDVPAKDSKEAAEQMIDRMVANIRFLLNKVPEEYRDRAKRWYEGGNKIATTWAERYGIPKQATAGVMAVLSPQMDWFTNVTLAERVLDAVYGHANERWSKKMTAIAKKIVSKDNSEAKVNLPALERAKGKTLKELIANGDYRAAAIWVRCYDQVNNDRGYKILTPEGGVGDYVKTDKDENATAAWGNYGPIEKAISIAANPSYANIFYQLGDKHKVRNFANNLNNPDSEFFTTVDTHAVGVGLMQPVSSTKSNSVLQNFGTGSSSSKAVGMSGSYFLYYEAIRRVAEETGLKPREVQSITWEAIRSLFPPHMKFGSEEQKKILELWRQGDKEIKNLEDPNDKKKVEEILDRIRNQVYDIGTEQTGVLRQFDWANTPFDATTGDTYKRSNVKIQKFDKRENGKGGSSFGIEAAPDPKNKKLTDLWEKVKKQNPQLAQQISDEVVENTIRKVFREFGLDFSPHTDLVPRLGGYLGKTNPSYELVIENPNLLLPMSKMLGKALNQESVMLVSSQEALGTTPHDIISISLPDGWGEAEIDEFYKKLYEIKGPKDKEGNPRDLFTGHSTSDGVMTIVNTDKFPVELLLNGIKSIAPNIAVEVSDGYCGFVSQDEYGFANENEKEPKPEEVVRVQIPKEWSKRQTNALTKKIGGLKNKKGVALASSTSTAKGLMTIERTDGVGMKSLLDAIKAIAPDLTVTKENKDVGLNTEFIPKKIDDRRANLIQREATEELERKLLAATGSDLQADGAGLDERKGRGDEGRNLKDDGGVRREISGKEGNQAGRVTTEQTNESTQGDEGASSMPKKFSITSAAGKALDKAEAYVNRNVRTPNTNTATGRGAAVFNNTQNKNKAQTWTEWLKDRFDKFYREWIDKNDAIHNVDDAIEKITGKKLAEEDKIYNMVQGARAYAQGAADTLVQGTKEAFEALKDSLSRGIDPKDTSAMQRLAELKKDFKYATMQQVLEPIMTKDMDKKYPNYLEKHGINNWHDAFSNYLGARRILELVRLVEDKSLAYITHDKKEFVDFIDRHPEYESFRPKPFAKGSWRDQVQKMAKADPVLAEKIAKDLAKEYKMPKGISRADLEALVREAPKEFDTSAQVYYQLQRNLLTMMELGHLIPADVHDKINQMYKEYCPLMIDYSDTAGLDTAIAQFGRGADSIANVDSMLKHVLQLGSDRGLISPLESTYKSIQALTNRSERNKVAVHFIKTVANSPELQKSGILQRVDDQHSPDAKNCIFTALIDGKKVAFKTTQDLYGPIVGYDMPAAGIVEGMCRTAAQTLRYGATTSPSFIIRNVLRDTIFAGVSSRNGFIPIIDSAKGMWAYTHDKELRGEFDAMGITAYNYFGSGKNAVKSMEELMGEKDWAYLKEHPTELIKELIKAIPKKFEHWSEVAEASTRMGEYMRARKAGKSMQEAALDARDVTLDFSRSGFYGQRVNMMVPFFNACIQGGDKMFNRMLFSKDPKVREQTMRMLGLYIMLPSIFLWFMHKDEPWYEELDPHIKMNNWIIGKFRIPKPQEAGIAFGSGIEAILDKIYNKDPKAGKEWVNAMREVLVPNLIPTVGLPMLEWVTNYSLFRDKPIEGNRLKRLPTEMRYNSNTTEISKALGKATGLSPVKLDNTIRGYTGTLGMLMAQIPDMFIEDKQNLPSKPITERAMVRDFFLNDMNMNRTSEDFYNLVNVAQQQHAGYGKKGKPTADVKAINKALRDVSKQQKDIQTITDAKNIPPDRKRQMIDKKREIIKTIEKKTLQRYRDKFNV